MLQYACACAHAGSCCGVLVGFCWPQPAPGVRYRDGFSGRGETGGGGIRRSGTGSPSDETHWLPNKEMTKLCEVSDETSTNLFPHSLHFALPQCPEAEQRPWLQVFPLVVQTESFLHQSGKKVSKSSLPVLDLTVRLHTSVLSILLVIEENMGRRRSARMDKTTPCIHCTSHGKHTCQALMSIPMCM